MTDSDTPSDEQIEFLRRAAEESRHSDWWTSVLNTRPPSPQVQDQLHPISTDDETNHDPRQPTMKTDTNTDDGREHQTTQPPYEDYKPSEHPGQAGSRNSSDGIDYEQVDEIMVRLKAAPTRFAILGLGIISVLMNWITVTALGATQSASGLSSSGGKLYLLGILGLIAIEFLAEERRHDAWMVGGALLSVISIGSLLYIQSRIDEAMAGLGFFAGAVDASLGLGIYLAVIVALVITYIGYQNSAFDVGDL